MLSNWSNKFWLFSSILYLARDLHDLLVVIQNEEAMQSKQYNPTNRYVLNESSGAYTSNLSPNAGSLSTKKLLIRFLNTARIVCLNKRNHSLLLDTIKNVFDVFLPLSNLNFVNFTPGMQGFCGLVSSLISILIIWDSKYKLTP